MYKKCAIEQGDKYKINGIDYIQTRNEFCSSDKNKQKILIACRE